MRAVLNGEVLAEAPKSETIEIEGNIYFPPASVNAAVLRESATPYTCPWKGVSQYFDVVVGDKETSDAAWSYPHPLQDAKTRVGADFSGYVAFASPVTVERS